MSSTYLSLNQQIEANKFLKIVQNLISKHGDLTDCILKLEILKVTRDCDEMILKLEHKNDESNS
jgi:hypothetical protein